MREFGHSDMAGSGIDIDVYLSIFILNILDGVPTFYFDKTNCLTGIV